MQPGPIDELELKVAVTAAEATARHELAEAIKTVKDDLRRDIKLYVGLGVLGGNAVAAFVMAKFGASPTEAPSAAVDTVRTLIGL